MNSTKPAYMNFHFIHIRLGKLWITGKEKRKKIIYCKQHYQTTLPEETCLLAESTSLQKYLECVPPSVTCFL